MSSWQSIETAPIQPFKPDAWYKAHSPYLLAWNGHGVCIASYHFTEKGKGKWHSNGRIVVGLTHWMPLPEGPSLETVALCTQCGGKKWFGDIPCSACNAMGEVTTVNRGSVTWKKRD